MRRIGFAVILAVSLVLAPLGSEVQSAGQIYRIGVLANVRSPATEGFQQGLRELGYVEGHNVVVEWRLAEGRFERLPELAAELVRLNVDVILAPASPYVRPARQVTNTIPIVFALVSDPVAEGFVTSLSRPGGHITGLSTISDELNAKRLELLKEAVPTIRRVGVLTNRETGDLLEKSRDVARALTVQLEFFSVQRPEHFEGAFGAMRRRGVQAIIELPGTTLFYAERNQIASLAIASRLPTMFTAREFTEAGGLMSYSASYPDLMRRAATYVDKILKGAKPADLPVEQPTKFELVINLKTAKALGLTIPQSLLTRADEIIQ